jgi:hypothetical protein
VELEELAVRLSAEDTIPRSEHEAVVAALSEERDAAVKKEDGLEETIRTLQVENERLRSGLCPECTAPMREHGCGGDYHAD